MDVTGGQNNYEVTQVSLQLFRWARILAGGQNCSQSKRKQDDNNQHSRRKPPDPGPVRACLTLSPSSSFEKSLGWRLPGGRSRPSWPTPRSLLARCPLLEQERRTLLFKETTWEMQLTWRKARVLACAWFGFIFSRLLRLSRLDAKDGVEQGK